MKYNRKRQDIFEEIHGESYKNRNGEIIWKIAETGRLKKREWKINIRKGEKLIKNKTKILKMK